MIEGLTAEIFQQCLGVTIPLPLPRLKYADAMVRYGSDKPDLRFGLEIVDCQRHRRRDRVQGLPATRSAAGGVVRGHQREGGGGQVLSNTALKPGGELPSSSSVQGEGPGLDEGRGRTSSTRRSRSSSRRRRRQELR